MMILNRLIKLLVINLTIFLVSSFLIISSASAENIPAGFGAGTMITTPNGNVVVENLEQGDRVTSYNFETHRQQENVVKEIKQQSLLSYYLINKQTKI